MGVLYPFTGILLSPIIASAAMAISSLSVVASANRLRRFRNPALASVGTPAIEGSPVVEVTGHQEGKEVAMAMVKDPVCGMEIDPKNAAANATSGGKVYHFCSKDCQQKFNKDPKKYVGRN